MELAPKRFKGKSQEEALQQLYGLIAGKEPANAGVTVGVRQATHSHLPPVLSWVCFLSHFSVSLCSQKVAKAAAVDRLTDTSKFTGSHKERFDETGKGKGKIGREEVPDASGYVGAYKGQGSYDDKVKEA